MCIFCAAIPTALAVGAATRGKRREAERRAEVEGRPAPPRRVPIAKATTALVVALVVASAVYHTQQPA
jgi:hypothetical protein